MARGVRDSGAAGADRWRSWRWSSAGCATATGAPGDRPRASPAGGWSWSARRSTAIPGLERFFLPAAALTCVLGGVGVAAAGAAGRRGWPACLRRPVTAGAAIVLAAACIPFTTTRSASPGRRAPAASQAVSPSTQLTQAVAAVGGKAACSRARSSFAAVNHSAQTALAWKLHVTLRARRAPSMRAPGVDFIGPHTAARSAAPATIDPRLTHAQTAGHGRTLARRAPDRSRACPAPPASGAEAPACAFAAASCPSGSCFCALLVLAWAWAWP